MCVNTHMCILCLCAMPYVCLFMYTQRRVSFLDAQRVFWFLACASLHTLKRSDQRYTYTWTHPHQPPPPHTHNTHLTPIYARRRFRTLKSRKELRCSVCEACYALLLLPLARYLLMLACVRWFVRACICVCVCVLCWFEGHLDTLMSWVNENFKS
jgi:hypothetical protein